MLRYYQQTVLKVWKVKVAYFLCRMAPLSFNLCSQGSVIFGAEECLPGMKYIYCHWQLLLFRSCPVKAMCPQILLNICEDEVFLYVLLNKPFYKPFWISWKMHHPKASTTEHQWGHRMPSSLTNWCNQKAPLYCTYCILKVTCNSALKKLIQKTSENWMW